MAGRKNKSKKPSDGSRRSQSLLPHDEFVLYLDENLCNSVAILATLTRLGIRFERQLSHFRRGVADETWLPEVARNQWLSLTADKRIRYNFLEKTALKQYSVREFVFTSGNMSGQEMARALELAIPKMIHFARV